MQAAHSLCHTCEQVAQLGNKLKTMYFGLQKKKAEVGPKGLEMDRKLMEEQIKCSAGASTHSSPSQSQSIPVNPSQSQ
jgi:hypothetical protein